MEFFGWWKILLSLWKIFATKFEYKTNTTKTKAEEKEKKKSILLIKFRSEK